MPPEPRPLRGRCPVPGDKSISHRALLLAALAPGESVIRGLSRGGDCVSTAAALRGLGVELAGVGVETRVLGPLQAPAEFDLDCGRSGTTMRLLAGLLAGTGARGRLTGHPQLLARPMERVARPLRAMGARVATGGGGRPPLLLGGGSLRGITYRLPEASAQVKSAILLAGLGASGATRVEELLPTRDHTERLLEAMGARLRRGEEGGCHFAEVESSALEPVELEVPGDPSSAAVLAAAAALVPGSHLTLEGVSSNPTRTGFFALLREMGAGVEESPGGGGPEPRADFTVTPGPLRAVEVDPSRVPALVDELPLLGLLGTRAEGTTVVRGAEELRVKESDRISLLVSGLRVLGAEVEEFGDGFAVRGPVALRPGRVDAGGDHRLAMTFGLAAMIASGPVEVLGAQFIADSFPEFGRTLEGVR